MKRLLIAASLATIASSAAAHTATGQRFAVATVQPIATDAAIEVLREGGNAVDAAVCAALTLGVVDNHNSGIGGGCLILIRKPGGELLAIDGRETAPALATRDMFLVEGKADPRLSQTGPLAVATPGALAAYQMALDAAGSTPLARLLAPGRDAARDGFAIDANYAGRLAGAADDLRKYPGSRGLLAPSGDPLEVGATLVQADLAATYQALIGHGPAWFYRGELARNVGAWMEANGGLLREGDFATYQAKRREPIRSAYRGRTVVGFPPPSSGGVHVAQVLGMLEHFDLAAAFRDNPTEATHLIAEAMKLAFADRAYWLGDSDFIGVPRRLSAPEYTAELAARIDRTRSTPVPAHGEPPQWRQDLFGRHTTHVAAADADGYWVAITATVNTGFGSKVIVPGTGVVLNNEMDDFSIQPGVPNAFGLVGAESNAVAPGKRPLSSMSPTIVLDERGEPSLTVGAAGGPRIISQVLLALVRRYDQGLSLDGAVAAPRFHHQWRPDSLGVEKALSPDTAAALAALGHKVERLDAAGVTQAIERLPDGGFVAVADPRVGGKASAE
ncbi:MAG: gamma-glutamyltransferase [Lacipirellulaceae bacterium]